MALVCVKDREICCLSHSELLKLVARREEALGGPEDAHTIFVTVPKGKRLRAYVNAPGKEKTILGNELIVGRNAFPEGIFG